MSNLLNLTTHNSPNTNDYTDQRKVRLEDFLDKSDSDNNKNYDKNNVNYDIKKNQENFGYRRRIKP